MKKMAAMMMAALSLCLLAGCGDTIDGSDSESYQRSYDKIVLELGDEQLADFVLAVSLIENVKPKPWTMLNGMTAQAVIDKAAAIDAKALDNAVAAFRRFPENVRADMLKTVRENARMRLRR